MLPDHLHCFFPVALQAKEIDAKKRIGWTDNQEVHLPFKMFCQPAEIETFIPLRRQTEQIDSGTSFAYRENLHVIRIAWARPLRRLFAHQDGEMLAGWLVEKTRGQSAGLATKALVDHGQHFDSCKRVPSGS